jgi:hypothetical protein
MVSSKSKTVSILLCAEPPRKRPKAREPSWRMVEVYEVTLGKHARRATGSQSSGPESVQLKSNAACPVALRQRAKRPPQAPKRGPLPSPRQGGNRRAEKSPVRAGLVCSRGTLTTATLFVAAVLLTLTSRLALVRGRLLMAGTALTAGRRLVGALALLRRRHRLYDVDISLRNLRHHWNACSRTSAAGVSDLPSVIHSSAACAV